MAGAPGPVEVQVLHQEAGDEHPHAVVHPSFGDQLPHPCVDDRVTGAALAPGVEPRGGAPAVDLDACHPRGEGLASRLRPVVQDVGVELAPAQLGAERALGGGRPELVQQLARMEAAPLEVGRQPRGGVGPGIVPLLVVAIQVGVPEPSSGALGGRLTRFGQAGVGCGHQGEPVGGHPRRPRHRGRGRTRAGPAVGGPHLRVRREHLVRLAGSAPHRAWVDGVGRSHATERATSRCQRGLDGAISRRAVGREVGGHEHLRRAHLLGERWQHAHGVPRTDDQVAAAVSVKGPEATDEEGPPVVARWVPQALVQAEDRHDRAPAPRGVGGLDQGRVIRQPEVAPEPDDRGDHPLFLPEPANGRRRVRGSGSGRSSCAPRSGR